MKYYMTITETRELREQIVDCFQKCREFEDCYGLKVNDKYSLFIVVQENFDYDDGTLEYFIELNDTSGGADEPCADYNVSCPLDNFNEFENVIMEYLNDNGICV